MRPSGFCSKPGPLAMRLRLSMVGLTQDVRCTGDRRIEFLDVGVQGSWGRGVEGLSQEALTKLGLVGRTVQSPRIAYGNSRAMGLILRSKDG